LLINGLIKIVLCGCIDMFTEVVPVVNIYGSGSRGRGAKRITANDGEAVRKIALNT
jgi:hypothetical protein